MPDAALSVIVVTPTTFAQVRRTVDHLRVQARVDEVELVVVSPDDHAVDDRDPAEVAPFAAVTIVPVGPIDDVDRAAAHGMLAASAPVVATIEDHAFVQAGWVDAVLTAYASGPWACVGSVMGNANPRRSLSWGNLLLGYGWWIDADRAGELPDVPSHNATYRRDALARFGTSLPAHVGRNGDLHDRLREEGERLFLAADASITHVNPSTWRSTAELRFQAGRLYGAARPAAEGWGTAMRLLYAAAWPLIPVVRLRRFHADHLAPGRDLHHRARAILPGLLAVLVLDALGQAVGYLAGPGRAPEVLATFEMDRLQHLDARDRALLGPVRR